MVEKVYMEPCDVCSFHQVLSMARIEVEVSAAVTRNTCRW